MIGPESLSTYVTALNLVRPRVLLSYSLCRLDEARASLLKALLGFQAVLGTEHLKYQPLRSNIAALGAAETKTKAFVRAESAQGNEEANVAYDADSSFHELRR